jgi:uncharacterized lipoprotein YbaY
MKAGIALVSLALALLPGCRRVDHDAIVRAKAELAGAWVREPLGAEPFGFDLRADGSVGLLGIDANNGLAWNRSRDELVISVDGESDPRPQPSRLRIASLEGDVLVLRAVDSEHFAGRYRRSAVERVTGVVTYLERVALPADARVEVRLTRDGERVARTRIRPREAVPIPFALSVLPDAGPTPRPLALEAGIAAGHALLFATPAPVPIEPGASDVSLLLRQSPPPSR